MQFNTNDQNYQTSNSRVLNFNRFSSNLKKEKDELQKMAGMSVKNDDEKHQVPGNTSYKFNKVTNKMDDMTPAEVKDKEEAIELDKPKHKYKAHVPTQQSSNEGFSIFDYSDFVVESKILSINESNVVYSTKLRKLLKDIESPVAKYLAEIENQDFNVANNYFDISDSKETVTFIADRRAQEIVGTEPKFVTVNNTSTLTHNMAENGNLFNALGYTPVGERSYKPQQGERGEIVSKTISPTSGNVFLYLKFPGGECVINESKVSYDDTTKDVWSKNRQPVRVGRGLRALVLSTKKEFTAAEYEDFVNKYKAAYDRMNDIFRRFSVVSGQEIGHWYSYRNYKYGQDSGTLGNSCMSDVDTNYFDIYMDNSDVCSLVILKSEDDDTKIIGRALLWKLNLPEGITFMDRIYSASDSDVQLFRDYAKSKGWYCKVRNDSSPSGLVIDPQGGQKELGVLKVKVKAGGYDKYPYIDTIKYYDREDGYLSTDDDNGVCVETTNGYLDDEECDRCGGSSRVECRYCDGECYSDCSTCDGSGKEECNDCDGKGKSDCETCDGTGEIGEEECADCGGSGEVDCSTCDGEGEQECGTCDGSGREDCDECGGTGREDCPECN